MIPKVCTIDNPDACAAAGCAMQGEPAEVCRNHRCPHRRELEAAEDRAGREERQRLSHERNGNEQERRYGMKEDKHLPESTEASIDWRKLPRNRPDKDEKHLAYSVLIANGISREKAATMLGYSPKTARSIDRALKEKGLKLELLSEQRIKKAHRVIDKCLAGKPFGEVETIKDSTALRAAEAILDRSNPKIQAVAPVSHSFTNVDLSIFLPDPPPAPKTIDLEPGADDELPEGAR